MRNSSRENHLAQHLLVPLSKIFLFVILFLLYWLIRLSGKWKRKKYVVEFKMPSTSMPSLKIGADEDSKAKQARSGVKSKLQEMNALLAKWRIFNKKAIQSCKLLKRMFWFIRNHLHLLVSDHMVESYSKIFQQTKTKKNC